MLHRCPECSRYTLHDACPDCDIQTRDPAPARFSPEDKHGEYRRRLKRLEEGRSSA